MIKAPIFIRFFAITLALINTQSMQCWVPGLFDDSMPLSELRKAVQARDYNKINELIEQGHQIDDRFQSLSALVDAIDDEEMVTFLLKKGANPNFFGVLRFAKKSNVIALLLNSGADPFGVDVCYNLDSLSLRLVFKNASKSTGIIEAFLKFYNSLSITSRTQFSKENLEKISCFISHGWVSSLQKKQNKRFFSTILWSYKNNFNFARLPKELLVHICSYLPGFYMTASSRFLKLYQENAVGSETERRISQVQKLINDMHFKPYFKKLCKDASFFDVDPKNYEKEIRKQVELDCQLNEHCAIGSKNKREVLDIHGSYVNVNETTEKPEFLNRLPALKNDGDMDVDYYESIEKKYSGGIGVPGA